MQISFYVLNERYAANNASSNHEALLDFVCKLTQTVLKKSDLSLVIVDDDAERLKLLDQHLWCFDPLSFIPHVLLTPSSSPGMTPTLGINSDLIDATSTEPTALPPTSDSATTLSSAQSTLPKSSPQQQPSALPQEMAALVDLAAPVVLTTSLPTGFDGVVLNLATTPLTLPVSSAAASSLSETTSNPALPERILEIIAPDADSKQQGREKYRYYQDQGHTLTYFPID